jgi:hypothetical protein
MAISMILLVTIPVVMTPLPCKRAYPQLCDHVYAAAMIVPFLPRQVSQVIFALLLPIMAVSVFADTLICMTMFGQPRGLSILGFIRAEQ